MRIIDCAHDESMKHTHKGYALGLIPVLIGKYKNEECMEARYNWCKKPLDFICWICNKLNKSCLIMFTSEIE